MKLKYDGKVYACSFSFALCLNSEKWKGLIPIFEQMLEWGDDVGSQVGKVSVCDEEMEKKG